MLISIWNGQWAEYRAEFIIMIYRSGLGYDVHAFKEGRKMILGGVEFESSFGLDGHSDADVLVHAIADACLGAMGLQDIGHFFPNDDMKWKDVSSLVFLKEISQKCNEIGAKIVNIDSTLVAEVPKINPRVEEMKTSIAQSLDIPVSRIGIKATTNELMGFVGRKEGIAALAVASLRMDRESID